MYLVSRSSSLRRALLKIHSTIFDIHESLWYIDTSSPLSPFEEFVVALEDRRFFRHRGIDSLSLLRELKNLLTLRRVNGASTIEMQLFRTLTGRYQRTASRKILELIAARSYYPKFKKTAILRSYLSIAYFGTGLTGSENASHTIFGRPSANLNHQESAELAAMLVYPKPKVFNANWQAKIFRRAKYGRLIDWTRPKSL